MVAATDAETASILPWPYGWAFVRRLARILDAEERRHPADKVGAAVHGVGENSDAAADQAEHKLQDKQARGYAERNRGDADGRAAQRRMRFCVGVLFVMRTCVR